MHARAAALSRWTYQGHVVDGADHGGAQPHQRDGARTVHQHLRLVLNSLPLRWHATISEMGLCNGHAWQRKKELTFAPRSASTLSASKSLERTTTCRWTCADQWALVSTQLATLAKHAGVCLGAHLGGHAHSALASECWAGHSAHPGGGACQLGLHGSSHRASSHFERLRVGE